jgi:putative Mn2+ efflux pump MntP
LLALVLVAASLGLSNFAGAIGIGVGGIDAGTRWRVGVVFGVFEAGMPVVGLAAGRQLTAGLGGVTRWAGAAVLIAVGGYELMAARRGASAAARGGRSPRDRPVRGAQPAPAPAHGPAPALASAPVSAPTPSPAPASQQSTARVLVSGLALSIDNLAVGFALGTLGAGAAGVLLSAVVIGGVSAAMSLAGLELGARIGAAAGRRSEIFGAVILIAVGAVIGTGLI